MNRYLRLVGAVLMLTPFINFLVSVAMLPPTPNKWTWAYVSALFFAASPLQWALRASKVVIGYLMLRAKSSAWLPVLVILVVTIAYNFLTFSRDFKTNSFQAVSSIIINFIVFGLVLNAEIKSQKDLNEKLTAARAARSAGVSKPQPQIEIDTVISEPVSAVEDNVIPLVTKEPEEMALPPSEIQVEFQIAKGSQIDFEGFGQFAEVVHCQDDELWIRGTHTTPLGITSRPVILESTENGTSVRLHYLRNNGPDIMIFKVS
ncbi:MAG: hypothetical protein ACKOX6_17815 [Bdellovibrio sp.]